MKLWNATLVVLTLFGGHPCLGQATAERVNPSVESSKPNYTITITPPSGPLSITSPLLVEMYYTNTTDSDIYMTVNICSTCTGERVILTKNDNEIEATPFHRMSTGRGTASDRKVYPNHHFNSRTLSFRPGVFWKFKLDLRKLYNITEPGEYTLMAYRTEYTSDGEVVIKSNTVNLVIVP